MSFIREYRVHHSSADGVLLQLPGSNGFGRLTKDSLGNDFLASELLKQFSSRDHAPAILTRRRDAQGYLLLSLHIKDAWSGIHGYPRQVRELLTTLVRKNILAGLGTTTVGRVVKSSEKGTVLSIAPNRMAVAACESIPHSSADGSSAQIEVRVLHVDLEAHVLNVTTQEDVIERTPMDTLVCAAALETIAPQSTVEAKVLLSTTDDGCAVVEIAVTVPSTGVPCSVLGYYIYNWTSAKTKEVVKPPVVGSTLKLVVEFCPNFSELRESAPFVILSDRKTFSGLPVVRSMPDADGLKRSRGLLGLLPWRSSASGEASDSEEDDEGGEASPDTSTRLRKRKLEEAIDSYERNMADAVPTTPEEFQRLLLGTPKSSFLWTQYMAYHVGLQQYEDARQVAEKALQTIGDSDSREQLNVWVTYLNIENLYGTTESLTSVFKRALARQLNGLALHQKLADIFEASRKTEQLLALCRSMTSKFRTSRAVWERLGVVLVNLDKRDQLKRVIKELGDALKREEAAMAVAHIAIHEYKNGSVENGRALFEGLLAKTPKKSDIWSQYIDQEQSLLNRKAEQASVTHVRSAMERAETMNFNAKVMQQFLTRHLAFEKVYGSPADLEKVKERARQYVESKIKSVTA